MHNHVVLNGRLLRAEEAKISPLGGGFMYGVGLFETIKVLQGRPVFFAEHFARLRASAERLSLRFAATFEELRTRCLQLIAANEIGEAALKIVVFQDGERAGEFILTRPLGYSAAAYERGFKLKTFSDRRPPGSLDALKTLNYLKNLVANRSAKAAGFDEALFVEESGPVLEASTSNIFIVKNGRVLTPPTHAILPGIMRARILSADDSPVVEEGPFSSERLFDADEVFVTNSLVGVMPVAAVDGHAYSLRENPVTRKMMETCRRLELQSIAQAVEKFC